MNRTSNPWSVVLSKLAYIIDGKGESGESCAFGLDVQWVQESMWHPDEICRTNKWSVWAAAL